MKDTWWLLNIDIGRPGDEAMRGDPGVQIPKISSYTAPSAKYFTGTACAIPNPSAELLGTGAQEKSIYPSRSVMLFPKALRLHVPI